MIVYPALVHFLKLDNVTAGIFLGGAIHDVAQVVGAGYLISDQTGTVATVVKLTRVACLVPVVVVLGMLFKESSSSAHSASRTQTLIPFFLLGFIALMIVRSFGLLTPIEIQWLNTISRGCLVIAIAALGIKTSFRALASLGWQPIVMLVADSVWIAVFVLISLIFLK